MNDQGDDGVEDVDLSRYTNVDFDDPLIQDLLFMPVKNSNESAFMLHMTPKIASYLKELGYKK